MRQLGFSVLHLALSNWDLAVQIWPNANCESLPLPHLAQNLAAHTLFTGLAAGHDAARRGKNVDAHAAEHPGNLMPADVHAATGPGHALHVTDGSIVVGPVLQI